MIRSGRPHSATSLGTVPALALALALSIACAGALAQPLASTHEGTLGPPPAAPAIALAQRLGANVALPVPFTDSTGHALRLADEFGPAPVRPVLLVLGYARCPQLCGVLMQGLLEGLRQADLPGAAWRIVFVSIDPADTPADAAARRRVILDYARFLAGGRVQAPPAIDLLVGPPASIAAVARQVGEVHQAGDATTRFAHPAVVIVLTPQGIVSRYLMGVRFDPLELRAALVEASGGRVGTLSDRVALMCAHLDGRLGAHGAAVMGGLRAAGLATLAALVLLAWRLRPRGPR